MGKEKASHWLREQLVKANQPLFQGVNYRLDPMGKLQPGQDIADMGLHRFVAHDKFFSIAHR